MQYAYQTPGPQGLLRVALPELVWPLRPQNGAKIVRTELRLNDKLLPSRYDDGAVRGTPNAPLAPGAYRVECRVQLEPEQEDATISWRFTVAPDAIASLPLVSTWAREALTTTNQLRAKLGLTPLRLDPRLCAAAEAHVLYLERNHQIGHGEQPGKPGFVGETALERAQTFGYLATLAEDVSYAEGSPEKIVRALFAAPYHRLPFLRPGPLLFGAGNKERSSGLLFGGDGTSGTVVSPGEGERGVPLTWRNDESPNPTRFWQGAPKVLGYPIVLAHYDGPNTRLTVQQASLKTADGTAVPCLVNTPVRDSELRYACLLLPQAPLKPQTTYQVEVSAREVTRRWRFTTGEASEADFRPLDLRPGELRLTGTVVKAERARGQLQLRVRRVQSYGTAPESLSPPQTLTIRLGATTRFLSESNRSGTVNLAPGLALAVIVPQSARTNALTARAVILAAN